MVGNCIRLISEQKLTTECLLVVVTTPIRSSFHPLEERWFQGNSKLYSNEIVVIAYEAK